jgi:hypothetical protein
MVDLRLEFNGKTAGRQLERSMQQNQQKVRRAVEMTANDAAAAILQRGRQDIASAGAYGARWIFGLNTRVEGKGSDRISVKVSHNMPMFPFLMKGGLIKGSPLLWIPLPFAPDAKNLGSPKNYPGKLVMVRRKGGGDPLLVSPGSGPKFIGKASVRISQKFHLLQIMRQVATEMKQMYQRNFGSL